MTSARSKPPARSAQQADLVRMLATCKNVRRSLGITEPATRRELELVLARATERHDELVAGRDYDAARIFGLLIRYLEVQIRDL